MDAAATEQTARTAAEQPQEPRPVIPIVLTAGKPAEKLKEITDRLEQGIAKFFDISQTEGKELPDIAVDELTGDVDRYKDFFAALEKTSPVPIAFENIEGGSHGYYHLEDKRIAINEGMSELQTLKTAIHEIAHRSCCQGARQAAAALCPLRRACLTGILDMSTQFY